MIVLPLQQTLIATVSVEPDSFQFDHARFVLNA